MATDTGKLVRCYFCDGPAHLRQDRNGRLYYACTGVAGLYAGCGARVTGGPVSSAELEKRLYVTADPAEPDQDTNTAKQDANNGSAKPFPWS